MKKIIESILTFFHERKQKRLYLEWLREEQESKTQKREDELEKFKELQRVPAIYRRNGVMR